MKSGKGFKGMVKGDVAGKGKGDSKEQERQKVDHNTGCALHAGARIWQEIA